MNDDLPNSNVADELHDELLVNRLVASDNRRFSNDLEKGVNIDEVPKITSGKVFLQPR